VKTSIKRNYLEINSIQNLSEVFKPSNNLNIILIEKSDFQLNRFFYKEIGKKHRWTDRLSWTEKNWIKYVNNSNIKTYVLKEDQNLVGYFEQIFHNEKKDCEIAYFGILEEFIGKKYGGYLLSEAIKESFNLGVKRVWVHTCSLDHKNALNNYRSRGMKIFKSETISVNTL
tara:strand:+ start:228 stop:740 length:513 start_codon:yes stop_codon:yes gene_type:complete